ncbi:DUF2628 domain-containing protein [Neobacillus sp. DY30]|uniref:DUF2628 domain-containing protein n=1 Tax=Neobacillus sp. DY30 TaxID=3047871 RepID=UPI0024BFB18F|nr:DUF2628 domain-containing protein [Neobacillus sp. DY30]WHY03269.1 DUF2628 domain-containing protein [Neobacillus sp. DY30]
MFCRYCGHQLNDEDRFCSSCGKAIDITGETELAIYNQNTNSDSEGDLKESFVGKNFDYYNGKWDNIEEKKIKTSWNWAAFFLGPFWFGYRKMYIPVLLFAAFYLAVDLSLFLLKYEYTEETYIFSPIDQAIVWPFSIILSLLGNYIYLKHTNKYIDKSHLLPINAEQKKLWFKKKGGTSWLGVLLTFFIFFGYGFLSAFLFPTNVDKILSIKDGYFYEYPTTTIGEQFNNFFDEPEWEYVSSDSPAEIIRFTGVAEYDGYDVNITVDFILTEDSFEIHSAKMNNEEMSDEEFNSLIDAIFASADNDLTL